MSTLRKVEWTVLGIALLIAVLAFYNVKRVIVHGISMEPSFHSGQTVYVLTSVRPSSLKIGDVIVLHSDDGDELIKRIVFIQNEQGTAAPPQSVWTPDGEKPFGEMFDNYDKLASEARLDGRSIWVMGDNYDHSEDSRDFGPIAPKSILGKVVKVMK